MNDPIIWQILLQIGLIMLNAVFACAEIAVISMNDNKLAQMAAQGDKRAVKLARLTSQPAKFLATIQVAITLSGFLGSAFAADNFSDKLVDLLLSLGVNIPISVLDSASVIVITLILSYFTLVFGELVPKRVAMKKAEALALGMSSLISFISRLAAPIVWVLTASTNGILILLGIDPNSQDDEVSEEEIRMMVDVGNQKGVIDLEEKEMIQNVFEFDNITIEEFATHRTDVDFLWLDEDLDIWEKTIHESRHSLYPVCSDSMDNVVAILDAKDYFRLKNKTLENIKKYAFKQPYFVPESICADILFKQMKKSRNHFAVVLDEYGGFEGIVTMNDLIEQLVGDLQEEIGCECFEQTDDGFKVSGSIPLKEVEERLAVNLPTEDYETFGGFVFSNYGSIPDDGTQFEICVNTLNIKVTKIKEHRIEEALISLSC